METLIKKLLAKFFPVDMIQYSAEQTSPKYLKSRYPILDHGTIGSFGFQEHPQSEASAHQRSQ